MCIRDRNKYFFKQILYCNYYIVNHSWVSRSTSRANRGPYQALSCSHVLVTCSHVICVWCCWRTSLTTGCSTPMIGWLCKDFVTLTTSLLELLWSEIGLCLSINSEEVPGEQFFKSQTNKKLFFLPCTDQYFVLWVCSIRVVKFSTKEEGRIKATRPVETLSLWQPAS